MSFIVYQTILIFSIENSYVLRASFILFIGIIIIYNKFTSNINYKNRKEWKKNREKTGGFISEIVRGAKDVKIVALLDKPEGRQVDIEADYVGFTIPNEFVVGYGLDYDQKYRNLPYVGVLSPSVYTK